MFSENIQVEFPVTLITEGAVIPYAEHVHSGETSLKFIGSDCRISLGVPDPPLSATPFTFSAWIYLTPSATYRTLISDWTHTQTIHPYHYIITGLAFCITPDNKLALLTPYGIAHSSQQAIPDQQWVKITLTVINGVHRFHINDVLDSTFDAKYSGYSWNATTDDLYIGDISRQHPQWALPFIGYMDEIKLYRYVVLTDENGLPLTDEDGNPITYESTPLTPEGETPPMSANLIQLKRRLTGEAGAPASLANSELAFNEVSEVLYYGLGADNDGNAVNIIPIAGKGAYLSVSGNQTIAGIKTFSGELHVNVPINPQQAANKDYVDTLIAQKIAEAIAGAFHYKGTLSAATNTFPADPVSGDLYRITAEGNFGGATPYTVSPGDHVVWNGEAWDKIDNTDPALSNTDGKITITRTGDNSYVINLADEWHGGTQITQLGTLTDGVWQASIIALNYGGTGTDLSNAPDGTLFKKMGSAFVPAIVGVDFVKTNFGTINGGTF